MYRLLFTAAVMLTLVGSAWSQTPIATAADADFNGNGEVEFNDFLLFVKKFNTRQGDGEYEARYDFDGDGAVSFADFLLFVGVFGQTVPAPALGLTEIVPAEGMPGELIELVGRFDVNTAYQVKFGTVLLPVFAQSAEQITAMVPVLESGSVQVRVVGATGWESEPKSFEVLALPEPRMNAEQLQQTVSDVGAGIGNALAPVIEAGVIPNSADAALFNQEMGKLNAAWDVLGERIEALPPEDAALLVNLLDNSGALEILEGLGQIDLSASKVTTDSHLMHHLLFRVDIVSALLGYASDLAMIPAIAAFLMPEPVLTKTAGVLLGVGGTVMGVSKAVIDVFIPTDLQRVKAEINPNPVLAGGVSDVVFLGDFKTESNLASELASQKIDEGITTILEFVIKKRIPAAKKLLEDRDKGIKSPASEALDEIVGFCAGIFSGIGIDETGLNNLFEKAELSRNDVPLDMELYRSSPLTLISWVIPVFNPTELNNLLNSLDNVGIDLISESVEVVDSEDVVNSEVAEYDPGDAQLKGIKVGVMWLKMRAFRFVEPGGESGDESGDENKGWLGRLGGIVVDIVKSLKDFAINLIPFVRFFNSMEHLEPEYLEFKVISFDANFQGITYDSENGKFYVLHIDEYVGGGKVYEARKNQDGSWEYDELFDLAQVPISNNRDERILLPMGITIDFSLSRPRVYVVGFDKDGNSKLYVYSMDNNNEWKQSALRSCLTKIEARSMA